MASKKQEGERHVKPGLPSVRLHALTIVLGSRLLSACLQNLAVGSAACRFRGWKNRSLTGLGENEC